MAPFFSTRSSDSMLFIIEYASAAFFVPMTCSNVLCFTEKENSVIPNILFKASSRIFLFSKKARIEHI